MTLGTMSGTDDERPARDIEMLRVSSRNHRQASWEGKGISPGSLRAAGTPG
jgi:hypothetical protein